MLQKFLDDQWRTSPPQVTSFLTYPRTEPFNEKSKSTYVSPTCGFGWRFQAVEQFQYQASEANPRTQELVGQVDLTFEPGICSSMKLRDITIRVKVSYPKDGGFSPHEGCFSAVSLKFPRQKIGSYTEPLRYNGPTHLEITLTFDAADGLAFPTTTSVNTKKALYYSLDGPSFADAKFYLFSTRVQGRPGIPKAVFAKSSLLINSSAYMHNLLSLGTGFTSGIKCNIQEDVAEEIAKLNVDAYEYDSDSDLGDPEDEISVDKWKGKAPAPTDLASASSTEESVGKAEVSPILREGQEGRAIAINGTAYKTWKAFVNYVYTNDIQFNPLRSENRQPESEFTNLEFAGCSPKSMYRFADYADLPHLKSMAKEGIGKSLSQSNIIAELFSGFTAKYQEIIELETDFLVDNFTLGVSCELDDMLQLIVLGTKPHCFRVLAFTMRRLRGDSTEDAWSMLDNEFLASPSTRCPAPLPRTQPSATLPTSAPQPCPPPQRLRVISPAPEEPPSAAPHPPVQRSRVPLRVPRAVPTQRSRAPPSVLEEPPLTTSPEYVLGSPVPSPPPEFLSAALAETPTPHGNSLFDDWGSPSVPSNEPVPQPVARDLSPNEVTWDTPLVAPSRKGRKRG